MDPYIEAGRLDPGNSYYRHKLANLALAEGEHATLAEELRSLPVKVTLQTTDVCNLDCPYCPIPRARKKPRMDEAIFERVIAELFPTLVELHPTNLGEPFLWPHFERLCQELGRFGVLLDLTTNGTLLTDERIGWIQPIARDVKISFDGAVPATFERLRRGASFDAVSANVQRLVLALSTARARPVVALQMTLTRSNYLELPALVRLAAELGAHRVRAYHLFSFSAEMDDESLIGDPDAWRRVLDDALVVASKLGIDLQCAEPAGGAGEVMLTPTACHLPWHETWIDFDGAVLPCHSHGGDVAGNLRDESFGAIWNGALYRRIRRGYRAAAPDWSCNGCGMNLRKEREHEPVPYDPEGFLSPAAAGRFVPSEPSPVRWSGRMRPFDLTGRRDGR